MEVIIGKKMMGGVTEKGNVDLLTDEQKKDLNKIYSIIFPYHFFCTDSCSTNRRDQ